MCALGSGQVLSPFGLIFTVLAVILGDSWSRSGSQIFPGVWEHGISISVSIFADYGCNQVREYRGISAIILRWKSFATLFIIKWFFSSGQSTPSRQLTHP